jgi:cytochrome d ubiquinol oxidase subunit I
MMRDSDALLLARIQFAFTVAVHIIFPAITIGLASYLVVLEGAWLRTRDEVYRSLYLFWSKAFAINFGMGVVSGLVLAYEFGTNWSRFSDFAGSVTGPLLTYEVLTAFFLEAGFLGVMLFGWQRVGEALHCFATVMVAVGTLVSATWILASNSWLQTPQGYAVVAGQVVPTDWLAVIFNPSFPFRLAHMAVAAFLATALVVGASGAWHLLRGRDDPAIRTMTSMAMWMLLIVAPVQIVIGDLHGLNTLEHQPAKIAAIEAHWENRPGEAIALTAVGWPDAETETTRYALRIPHLGSLILTHSWAGQFPGLKDFDRRDRPNVAIVFWSFRVMVGLAVLMVGLGLWAAFARWRGSLYRSRPLLRAALWMGPAGVIAILAGWITAEVGRQPWVVYGLMRTEDAVSAHSVVQLSVSLALFVVVYLVVFGAGVVYLLGVIAQGPGPAGGAGADQPPGGPGQPRQPLRPLSVVPDRIGFDAARSRPGA